MQGGEKITREQIQRGRAPLAMCCIPFLILLQVEITPSRTRSCRPWQKSEFLTWKWGIWARAGFGAARCGMGANGPALSRLDTAPWGWCTWMLTPTPATGPWGRRSTTGPRSGAAWTKGCWTAAAWFRSASAAPPTPPTLTNTAGSR